MLSEPENAAGKSFVCLSCIIHGAVLLCTSHQRPLICYNAPTIWSCRFEAPENRADDFHHAVLYLAGRLVNALILQTLSGVTALTRDKLRYPRGFANKTQSVPAIVTWLDESYTSFAHEGKLIRMLLCPVCLTQRSMDDQLG